MADQCPNKNDIVAIFKRLRNQPANKVCFDCNAKNPTWSSVTYGVFICIDCSAVHRGLGVHLTFVRSTQLDTNWTWIQLRQMQLGGNANATSFFRQHNSTSNDAQQKYNSRAAQLYRDKLHQLAVQAMRIHGTQVHLDSAPEQPAPEEKEVDFFDEIASAKSTQSAFGLPVAEVPQITTQKKVEKKPDVDMPEPSVDMILSSDTAPQVERKSTIGSRKPAARKGLGAKKGLGAQRVKANFEDIEREAQMHDENKVRAEEEAKKVVEVKPEDEEKQFASMRLAYQDLSLKQKKEEEKMKQVDPKKAQQMERLGMGFANRSGISHSAISDMKTIQQEGVVDKKPSSSSAMGGSRGSFESDFFDDFSYFDKFKGGNSTQSSEPKSMNWGSFEGNGKDRAGGGGSKGWTDEEPRRNASPPRRSSPPRSSRPSRDASASVGDEAQKKFGSAKAISSDQFFQDSASNDWERKSNLQRFEGSSSISSADYFDDGRQPSRSGGSGGSGGYQPQLQSPDLDDMKESVRQGVTKVAGKLSNLANGVMNSFQERYGY